MYLYSKKSVLLNLVFRGVILSKTKKNKKQTLIFLRSPKHFNVGKRKVISFNNKAVYTYNIKLPIFTNNLKNNTFFLILMGSVVSYNTLFRINSLKITTISSISWK